MVELNDRKFVRDLGFKFLERISGLDFKILFSKVKDFLKIR